MPNPFETAEDIIDTIREILSETPVSLDVFPDLPNPFRQSIIPNLGNTPAGQLPPNVANATPGFVGQQNVSIPYTQLPQDQKLDRIEKVDKLI